MKQASKRTPFLLYAGFLLGLLIHTKDGDGMFLRKVCSLSPAYTALYPRRYRTLQYLLYHLRFQRQWWSVWDPESFGYLSSLLIAGSPEMHIIQ
jgi:hypothetical protein